MLHWFHKNRYLADYLEGFVDIHNHILPGIDDGANSVAESLELIQAFGDLGIQKFIATPHILQPLYPNTPETIKRAHQKLLEALMDENRTNVSIEPAAEHMIDEGFEDLLEKGDYMPIKGSYLLVEMSYLQPSLYFDEAIIEITKKGLTPILAHPERYLYLHQTPKKYQEYKSKGILFQMNMLSLGEYYGKDVKRMGQKLLQEGMIDFIASDMHNMRHMNALREIRLKEKFIHKLIPLISRTIEVFY
jgi:tyrosine-protein phosphatase YwqE